MKRTVLATAIATALSAPAAAQLAMTNPEFEPGPALENGYSAQELQDAELYGSNGEQIAEVEDVIIGPNEEIARLAVTANEGIFGTGGRRLAVDWQDVEVSRRDGYDIERISVDVIGGNLEESGLFKDGKDAVRGGRDEWRADELIGDDVDLENSFDDGYVSDMMFDREGRLRAIAATTGVAGTAIEFFAPYSADEGREPGDDFYVVDYSSDELEKLLPAESTTS